MVVAVKRKNTDSISVVMEEDLEWKGGERVGVRG